VLKLAAGGQALADFVTLGTLGGSQSARFGSRGEDFVFARRL
jgi:hypothetical protein